MEDLCGRMCGVSAGARSLAPGELTLDTLIRFSDLVHCSVTLDGGRRISCYLEANLAYIVNSGRLSL